LEEADRVRISGGGDIDISTGEGLGRSEGGESSIVQVLSPFVELWFMPLKTRTDRWGLAEVPWWR
jgi:hypothetical protein